MAVYEFKCCGITKEITANIFLDLVTPQCDLCNGDMQRVYSPVGVSFNAKGFYSTDNRR